MGATITIRTLSNAAGTFENMPTALTADTAAEVQLEIGGLDITIESENSAWSTSDPMGYTITLTNTTTAPFEAPITVRTDAYPPSICKVDDTSIQVNGETTGFTASVSDGILTINLEDDIAGGGTAAITFQISKITTP